MTNEPPSQGEASSSGGLKSMVRSGSKVSFTSFISGGEIFAGCTSGVMSGASGQTQPTTIGQTSAPPAQPTTPAQRGTGPTYYVSPTGNDFNSGMSSNAPWQSMAKGNAFKFGAGSSVLFEGGQSFTGFLKFSSRTNVRCWLADASC